MERKNKENYSRFATYFEKIKVEIPLDTVLKVNMYYKKGSEAIFRGLKILDDSGEPLIEKLVGRDFKPSTSCHSFQMSKDERILGIKSMSFEYL